jgi:hypothetical protein
VEATAPPGNALDALASLLLDLLERDGVTPIPGSSRDDSGRDDRKRQ